MPELSFAAMTANDLEWVAAREAELHAHPWSRGNFMDALAAGYEAWIMHRAGEPSGYAIVLNVLDEAHLLDIGVALYQPVYVVFSYKLFQIADKLVIVAAF